MEEKKGKIRGANMPGSETVGRPVSLKAVYEIAKIKQTELRLSGLSLEALTRTVIASAKTIGVKIEP